MPVKIRLQRHGRAKAPVYHIVIANSTSPRDGKFIEKLGIYNPQTIPATVDLNNDKAIEWLHNGAQPTDTVRRILSFKGVMFKKHLMRGVKMGTVTQEQADAKWDVWAREHAEKTSAAAAKGAAGLRKKNRKEGKK